MAYIAFSGEQYYAGSEFQNIGVMSLDYTQQFTLTTRGGAWYPAWSPDGLRLAYSDYDASGVGQVYISNQDGTDRVRLTDFTKIGTRIGVIRWSHDGSAIAFAAYHADEPGYFYHPDETGSLWIVSADGIERQQVNTESNVTVVYDNLWWSQDNKHLIFYAAAPDNQGGESDALYWVDVTSSNMSHILPGSETPDGLIVLPFLVDSQAVGFIGDYNNLYLYDTTAQVALPLASLGSSRLLHRVRMGPPTFPGEAQCEIPGGSGQP
jgi:Tol biopolymer transport system component